jgi:hypothetical protein
MPYPSSSAGPPRHHRGTHHDEPSSEPVAAGPIASSTRRPEPWVQSPVVRSCRHRPTGSQRLVASSAARRSPPPRAATPPSRRHATVHARVAFVPTPWSSIAEPERCSAVLHPGDRAGAADVHVVAAPPWSVPRAPFRTPPRGGHAPAARASGLVASAQPARIFARPTNGLGQPRADRQRGPRAGLLWPQFGPEY